MPELLIAVALLLLSGLASIVTWRSPRWSTALAAAGSVMGCVVGLVPAIRVLAGGDEQSLRWAWRVPVGEFALGIDSLSAFFLVPILILTALAAVYGGEYMLAFRGQRSLGAPAFFFNSLAASMVVVVIARNGLVFLMAWELMSLSAYFLVTFEHDRDEVRRAGWVYLVATNLGAAFLVGLFMLLGRSAGSLSFDDYRQSSALGAVWSATFFILALVGFGAKAGFVPYHVWLSHEGVSRPALLLSVGIVALVGGLALACFVRLVGTVLLGTGRSDGARHAHESSRWLTIPMGILIGLSIAIALFPRFAAAAASSAAEPVLRIPAGKFMEVLSSAESPLRTLATLNGAVWLVVGFVAAGLVWLRRRGVESTDATWGCGYAQPTARMQYTGSSFAEFMVGRVFPRFLRRRITHSAPSGLFPRDGALASDYPDPLHERVYEPFFAYWAERFARLRWVQQGKVHFYIVYFLVVIVISFVWISVRAWIGS
jgi:formate hydrogenlyase subunit 3/multisubunit Na+/H+ antiporter MnhD subunit